MGKTSRPGQTKKHTFRERIKHNDDVVNYLKYYVYISARKYLCTAKVCPYSKRCARIGNTNFCVCDNGPLEWLLQQNKMCKSFKWYDADMFTQIRRGRQNKVRARIAPNLSKDWQDTACLPQQWDVTREHVVHDPSQISTHTHTHILAHKGKNGFAKMITRVQLPFEMCGWKTHCVSAF